MPKKILLNINDILYDQAQDIRSELTKIFRKNISFACVFNALAFSGLIASDKLNEDDWEKIKSFVEDFLNKESKESKKIKKYGERYVEEIISRIVIEKRVKFE